MSKFFRPTIFICSLILLVSCSFKKPVFFEDKLKILEEQILKKNTELVFAPRKKFNEEIKGNISGEIPKPIISKNWSQKNFTSNNHLPHFQYENEKQLVYKSKKIGKNKYNSSNLFFEPLLVEGKIFYYDPTGSIFNFSTENQELNWKFNFYKKRYKNIPIKIKLKYSKNNLVVTDNVGYIYSLSIDTGKLQWAKNYGIPFLSNIKIDEGNIFALNQDNKYYIINELEGQQILSLETFPSFLKSKQETNLSIDSIKNNIYFITSTGELYSINYRTKNINWVFTLFLSSQGRGSDLFYSSPIVYKKDQLFFSSSNSTYSINSKNGSINWELPFSTNLRPIVSGKFIFLASKNGFLININSNNGKVIWSKDVFKNNEKLKKNKIGEIMSLLLVSDQILVTTSKGFFLFINYKNGEIINYTKASRNGFFSNPILVNKKIHIIDNKMRVLIFN